MREKRARRDDPLLITVKRFDGGWWVLAHEPGVEHTHYQRWRIRDHAEYFSARVLARLDRGEEIYLRYWSSRTVDPDHYENLYRYKRRARPCRERLK
jgi:hypothetical protein